MKKVLIFLCITFLGTWVFAFSLMADGGYDSSKAAMILSVCMIFPALAAIITTIISKNNFRDMWIKPNLKGNIKFYLLAWIAPAILILIGAAVYYCIFPNDFDINMTTTINMVLEQSEALGQTVTADQLKSSYYAQIFIALVFAPIVNIVTSLGIEVGFRGYLLPNLCKKYSPLISTIITGVLWGVWFAPLVVMGYGYGVDYNFAPWGGILAMIIFCITIGMFLSFITLKVKSVIPAVIAYGVINGYSGVSTIFLAKTTANPFVGPLPLGILGGSAFIILAIVCFILIKNMSSKDRDLNEYISIIKQ